MPSRVAVARPVVLAVLLLAYAGFASGLATRTVWIAFAALVPAGVVVVLTLRRGQLPDQEEPPPTQRAVRLWSVLLALGLLWEAWAFFHQPAWDVASYAHPSLSSLVDPYLQNRAVRFGAWTLWLYAGIRLVRP